MALVAGTVSVTADGAGAPVYTGSGLARALAEAHVAAQVATLPALPAVGSTSPPFASSRPADAIDAAASVNARQALYASVALQANAYASAIVSYLVTNAQVTAGTLVAHVTTQSLGVTPNPNTPGQPIVGPAAPVDVPVTGAGTLT